MPMIQTVNLSKRFDGLMALSNLNLKIDQGDCFGFIGPNGAGKTTTLKILATLLKPTWGEARIDGLSVGPVNARQVRFIIGYVPDQFGSYPDMVVREYLAFFAASYSIHGKQRQRAIDDVLDLTDMAAKADVQVNTLSRGMKQRISLARVLLHDPKVLLLDEPAAGLDPRSRVEIRELLKELHRMGKTIVISSHILQELADLCTQVGVIEQGELKFLGTTQQLLDHAAGERILHVGVAARREEAAEVLAQAPGVIKAVADGELIRVTLDPTQGDPATIAARLVHEGYSLTRLEEAKADLETAFLRLTKI